MNRTASGSVWNSAVRVSAATLVASLAVLAFSCSSGADSFTPSPRMDGFPRYFLWAWERPEDLRFLDTDKFGVAFLAQTITLSGDDAIVKLRRQPLEVPPGAKLIAVTRVESRKHSGDRIALSEGQREKLTEHVNRTLQLPHVAGVQIDFDVVVSERQFYRSLLEDLRAKLPDDVPLSITALASFCLGDRWLKGIAIDEAVPMIFRMGDDREPIRKYLENGGDLREPLCRTAYGISLDEIPDMKFDSSRRIYLFNPRPWKESDLNGITERLSR